VLSKLPRFRSPKTESTLVGAQAAEDRKARRVRRSDTLRLARDFSYELGNRGGLGLRRPDAVQNFSGLFDNGMEKPPWSRKLRVLQ
jgi:hypothetical protein